MTEFCWMTYPASSGECERNSLTLVWRDGRCARACAICGVVLSEWITHRPAQPDTEGPIIDSADLVRQVDLGS